MSDLQTILFGTFVPPNVPSRPHRIGLTGGKKYEAPKVRDRAKSNLPAPSELRILKEVRKSHPMTSDDAASVTGMTRNHCGIILNILFKKGLVTRVKHKIGRKTLYVYSPKAADAS